jgi:maltooligosyltrehalose trehalohydrolase
VVSEARAGYAEIQSRGGSAHARRTHRETFLGARHDEGVTRFRVWAPEARHVEAHVEYPHPLTLELQSSEDGYFVGESDSIAPGSLYKYFLDSEGPWPDPCSRYQPHGPHGPSAVIDPTEYRWQCPQWAGARLEQQTIYELHIGAFTPEGTFDAARARLACLRDLGITMIELLPVAECPGRWNWGYDGVQIFAPFHEYGDPEAFRRFVDRAHELGLAVILDIVYNHVGPDGNYLKHFSPRYFSCKHRTEWGEAFNFDGEHCFGARDFVINNAKYWLSEYQLDGFRLDATQSMFDTSEPHILAQLVAECRESSGRDIVFVAENEPQRGEHLLPPDQGGFDLDGMWNDDFHHAMRVALSGCRDGYFLDYTGCAQEILSALKYGFLYQGQYYTWQRKPRGSPLRGSPRHACVHFLQNHDQVANTGLGERLHTFVSPRRYRAATAVLLLGPQTPLLFMGQEFLASNRFMFFADHEQPLRDTVHQGRREFLRQFRSYASRAVQEAVPDPGDERTFMQSKLDWDERNRNTAALALHEDLLRLRREDVVLSNSARIEIDGATLGTSAFLLRWFGDLQERLLIVNFGRELHLEPVPEPLLAPPRDRRWALLWSSEDPRYGGLGVMAPVSDDERWRIPAECAVLLQSL